MPLKPEAAGRFSIRLIDEKTGKAVVSEQFFRGSDVQRRRARESMLRTLASKLYRQRLRRVSRREEDLRGLMQDATLDAGLLGRAGHKRFRTA